MLCLDAAVWLRRKNKKQKTKNFSCLISTSPRRLLAPARARARAHTHTHTHTHTHANTYTQTQLQLRPANVVPKHITGLESVLYFDAKPRHCPPAPTCPPHSRIHPPIYQLISKQCSNFCIWVIFQANVPCSCSSHVTIFCFSLFKKNQKTNIFSFFLLLTDIWRRHRRSFSILFWHVMDEMTHYIWHKCPLWLEDDLVRTWSSKVKGQSHRDLTNPVCVSSITQEFICRSDKISHRCQAGHERWSDGILYPEGQRSTSLWHHNVLQKQWHLWMNWP